MKLIIEISKDQVIVIDEDTPVLKFDVRGVDPLDVYACILGHLRGMVDGCVSSVEEVRCHGD